MTESYRRLFADTPVFRLLDNALSMPTIGLGRIDEIKAEDVLAPLYFT